MSDVWTDIHRTYNTRLDENPCRLPIHLLKRSVLMSSELLLDSFLGTGTTAIAANCNRGSEALPRRFLGNIRSIRDIDAIPPQL